MQTFYNKIFIDYCPNRGKGKIPAKVVKISGLTTLALDKTKFSWNVTKVKFSDDFRPQDIGVRLNWTWKKISNCVNYFYKQKKEKLLSSSSYSLWGGFFEVLPALQRFCTVSRPYHTRRPLVPLYVYFKGFPRFCQSAKYSRLVWLQIPDKPFLYFWGL